MPEKRKYPTIELKGLKEYGRNSRIHEEKQIEQLGASIHEFGFTVPIIVRKGMILAGHARVEAAKRLGMAEVPYVSADHLTEEQARALVIADNKLHDNSHWDINLMREEIGDLAEFGIDLDMLGFSEEEINFHLGENEVSFGFPGGDGPSQPITEGNGHIGDDNNGEEPKNGEGEIDPEYENSFEGKKKRYEENQPRNFIVTMTLAQYNDFKHRTNDLCEKEKIQDNYALLMALVDRAVGKKEVE